MKQTQKGILHSLAAAAGLLFALSLCILFSRPVLAAEDVLYLSDQTPVSIYVAWGSLKIDQSPSDAAISLKVNGSTMTFEKGIGAHAESILIYDLTEPIEEGFDYFRTYYGVDTSRGSSGSVRFYLYTTTDDDYASAEWTPAEGMDSSVKTGSTDAGFIEIPLTQDMTYLKLYADPDGGIGSDHSEYGDAKFIKSGQYYDAMIPRPEEYDEELKSFYQKYGTDLDRDPAYEQLLLERELIDRTGYYEFQDLLHGEDGEGIKEMVSWLFDHPDFLTLYLTGGSVGGNYLTGGYSYTASSNDPYTASLQVLYDFWQKYPEDFTDESDNGMRPRMILALSLSLTGNVKFWYGTTGGTSEDPTDSSIIYPDPVERYEIYLDLYDEGLLVDYFDELQVPELRYVMGSSIHNDELKWASELAKKNNYNTNCYFWMHYAYDGYSYHRDQYYTDETWGTYDEKYDLSAYGISNYGYGTTTYVKYPMDWMGMEDGGTCWPIANLCQNIWSSYGRPCYICGCWGGTHEVYMAYNRLTDDEGNSYGRWSIENGLGVSWADTHYGAYDSTGWHIARMLCDWGMGSDFEFNNASYIVLGQAAINDFDHYVRAEKIEMLSHVFEDDEQKLEEIYRAMLDEQGFHFDAWYGLVKLYTASSDRTDEDFYELAAEMMDEDALLYYPLPLNDLVKLVLRQVDSVLYESMILNRETSTLTKAAAATDDDFYHSYSTRDVANRLLSQVDGEVASFSFDGEDAGKIILDAEKFPHPEYWEYSLNGGETWSAIIHDEEVEDADGVEDLGDIETEEQRVVKNPNVVTLSDEEIAQINEEDDIQIRFIQVPDYWYTIDIEKAGAPVVGSTTEVTGLYANPWENRVIGATDEMEWRDAGTDEAWTSFAQAQPDREQNPDIEVRYGAYSCYTAGSAVTLSFDEKTEEDETHSYISLDRLEIASCTTQANSTRASAYALDGNIYSFYQSVTTTTDPIYMTLKLDAPTYLSKLEYQCNLGNTANGQVREAQIYVSMDGENWTEVEYDDYDGVITWGGGNSASGKAPKEASFTPVLAQYITLAANSCTLNFMSIGDLRIYEDASIVPQVEIEYSTTEPTNQPVTATLITDSLVDTVTNNGGSPVYTFTENGAFVFEYVSGTGQKYEAVASVSWIDLTAPTAQVEYAAEEGRVLVTVSADETLRPVEGWTLSEDGRTLSRLFTEEDSRADVLTITDLAGNTAAVVLDFTALDEEDDTGEENPDDPDDENPDDSDEGSQDDPDDENPDDSDEGSQSGPDEENQDDPDEDDPDEGKQDDPDEEKQDDPADESKTDPGDESGTGTGDESETGTGDESETGTGDESGTGTGDESGTGTGDESKTETGEETGTESETENREETGDAEEGPAKGFTFTYANRIYQITDAAVDGTGTVTLTGRVTAGTAHLNTRATVKYNGISYRVTCVGENAFEGYTNITSVKIGKYVTNIAADAFNGCTSLQTVTGCTGVTRLGSRAFANCTSLETVSGMRKLVTVKKRAFYKCSSLTQIGKVSGAVTLAKVETLGSRAFYKCTSLQKVRLTSPSLGSIGNYAFRSCTSLKTLICRSTELSGIGRRAFYKDRALSSVTFYTTKLKSSSVSAQAFEKISADCRFTVPAGKGTSYRKIFLATGADSRITVKEK